MSLLFSVRVADDHPLGKELFIRFTALVFRECLSIRVCSSFPFCFEDGMWELIVLIPDHCLTFCFISQTYEVLSALFL